MSGGDSNERPGRSWPAPGVGHVTIRVLACATLLLCQMLALGAEEEIVSFHSRIDVHTNATLTVVETIRVRSEQRLIQHGILRDYAMQYRDRAGRGRSIDLDVQSVRHDGRPEAFTVEQRDTDLRLKVGQEETILAPREHEYEITCQLRGSIERSQGLDELFWNVTGDRWPFAIKEAQATVRLPPEMPRNQVQFKAYTSPFKSIPGAPVATTVTTEGDILFRVTDTLNPGRGLAIQVSWPTAMCSIPVTDLSSFPPAILVADAPRPVSVCC